MSHPSPNVAAQPQPLSSPSLPDPAELAERLERLQTAAQDLLAACASAGRDPKTGKQPAPAVDDETRRYYLSPKTLRQERELLQHYRAQDFPDLLAQTHMLLAGLARIMRNTPHELRVKGYVIAGLGCLLDQACALVLRMRNVYGGVEKIGT